MHVNPAIEVPAKPNMVDQGLAMMGLIGLIAAHAQGASRSDTIASSMAGSDIRIDDMVRSEFEAALSQSGVFQVADASTSDAEVRLKVLTLGMHRPMGLTEDLKPMIGIEASLIDESGTTLWKRRESTGNLSEKTPAYSFDEYVANPEHLREVFDSAIKLTVTDLVSHLRQP